MGDFMSTSNDICFRPLCQLELISRSPSLLHWSQAVLSPQTQCCKTTTLLCDKFCKQAYRIDCGVLTVSCPCWMFIQELFIEGVSNAKSSILFPQRNAVLIKLLRILQTACWSVARYKDAGMKAVGNLKQQFNIKCCIWHVLKINELLNYE